jgi:hypothetical protein
MTRLKYLCPFESASDVINELRTTSANELGTTRRSVIYTLQGSVHKTSVLLQWGTPHPPELPDEHVH